MNTVSRWNAIYGQQFAAVVVPTNWQQHSVAEHGVRPQEALNTQLVDDADIVIAIFWHRLGSPTGEAESGTVEEIERALRGGAYVGILRCSREVPPAEIDAAQLQRLREFYEGIQSRSLILEYRDDAGLARHVDAILNTAVSASRTRGAAEVEAAQRPADVWPRIESSENVETDARGRVRTRRSHQLVLANTGSEAARQVSYWLEAESEDENLPVLLHPSRELESLAPGGEAKYSIMLTMASAPQARCVVQWVDSEGEHENVATLRFY